MHQAIYLQILLGVDLLGRGFLEQGREVQWRQLCSESMWHEYVTNTVQQFLGFCFNVLENKTVSLVIFCRQQLWLASSYVDDIYSKAQSLLILRWQSCWQSLWDLCVREISNCTRIHLHHWFCFFAFDHPNNACWLPIHIHDMMSLDKCTDLWQQNLRRATLLCTKLITHSFPSQSGAWTK